MAACYSHLTSFALTDVGCKRKNNEDAYQVFPEYGVFVVADGMGGAEDGEVASQAIMDELAKTLKAFDPAQPLTCQAVQAWVCHAVNEASAWILNRSQERGKSGTGSTFVGVCFDPEYPDRAVALHAGDSRVYHIRGSAIQQVTRDHSLANAAGIKDEMDLNPKFRGVILRAVGLSATTEVEATPFDVDEGDTVIICSDGLSKMVDDETIATTVHRTPDTEAAVRQLIAMALKQGGKDNVTVIAIKVGALPEPLPFSALQAFLPPDFGHAKTDSNPTPQTPLGPPAGGMTRLTEYRTPLAPITVRKPVRTRKDKTLSLLLAALTFLLVSGLGGAGLGIYFKKSAEKQAAAIEQIQEDARKQALRQIQDAEEAEAKRKAEEEAKRLQEEERQREADRLKAEEEAVQKAVAEKRAEEERLKLEAQKEEQARQRALEEKRAEEAAERAAAEKRARAARQKAEAEKKLLEERQKAEAEKKLLEERQKAEAERQRLAEEKQKAEDEAARLAAAVAIGGDEAGFSDREKSVLHLVRLAKHEAQAKTYCTFMVVHAPKNSETPPLVADYDEARQALLQWADSQILTANKLKQLTEAQLEPIRTYAKALAAFLNTNAIELYAKRTRMKEPSRKTWDLLVKEAAALKLLPMDTDASRLRLAQIVQTISSEAK